MNYLWAILIIISIICSILTGRVSEISNSIMSGAQDAVTLVISMLGMMCFWTGLMNIAEKGGLTYILAKILSPVLKRLFPDYDKDSKAMRLICMNVTANILGLGNAATPFGIEAMKEMQKENKIKDTANNSMIMFVVLNTASLQIVPTLLTILRQKQGSEHPLDILPAIWITSFISLMVGITAAKLFEKRGKNIG